MTLGDNAVERAKANERARDRLCKLLRARGIAAELDPVEATKLEELAWSTTMVRVHALIKILDRQP